MPSATKHDPAACSLPLAVPSESDGMHHDVIVSKLEICVIGNREANQAEMRVTAGQGRRWRLRPGRGLPMGRIVRRQRGPGGEEPLLRGVHTRGGYPGESLKVAEIKCVF
jgi:hypothetical protein